MTSEARAAASPPPEAQFAGALVEEDLMPLADPGQGKAYWQQVSLLVSRSRFRDLVFNSRPPGVPSHRIHKLAALRLTPHPFLAETGVLDRFPAGSEVAIRHVDITVARLDH